MKNSRTFIMDFSDNGTFSGRVANNLSQMGGWPVYIFIDSVVFLTMPLGDRITALAGGPVLETFLQKPGLPGGPNTHMQDKVREVQRRLRGQAQSIINQAGIDRVDSDDLRAIPGAVVVPASNIKRVTLKPHLLTRNATTLLFEMYNKDPEVPFRERKRQRVFTFGRYTSLSDLEELMLALEQTFGDKFENHLKTSEQAAIKPPTRASSLAAGLANAPYQQLQLSHDDYVNIVAFSPDGTRLATSSSDKRARIWDTATGRQLIQVTHEDHVLWVAFSPDGTRLATAGTGDMTARLWDTTTGQELIRMKHQGPVFGVAFSPDGTRLATTSDKQARLWDVATGRELRRMAHKNLLGQSRGALMGVAFSPDGTRLATAGIDDKTARIWNTTTGQQLTRVKHQGPVLGVAFSPDGTRLATAGTDDKTARIWNTTTGQELTRVKHQGSVHGVAFSPDGTRLATASRDKTARIWDCATGEELVRVPHNHFVHEVAFSNDGCRLATANGDKTARIWKLCP